MYLNHVFESKALDGKSSRDYVQRVEPSAQGGKKIASLIIQKLGLGKNPASPTVI